MQERIKISVENVNHHPTESLEMPDVACSPVTIQGYPEQQGETISHKISATPIRARNPDPSANVSVLSRQQM